MHYKKKKKKTGKKKSKQVWLLPPYKLSVNTCALGNMRTSIWGAFHNLGANPASGISTEAPSPFGGPALRQWT